MAGDEIRVRPAVPVAVVTTDDLVARLQGANDTAGAPVTDPAIVVQAHHHQVGCEGLYTGEKRPDGLQRQPLFRDFELDAVLEGAERLQACAEHPDSGSGVTAPEFGARAVHLRELRRAQ